MMDGQRLSPGWFGKLPSQGDFLLRRLPPLFTDPWDRWLSAGLAGWQQRAPDTWLADYLQAPPWLFVAAPGVLPGAGPAGFAGVLMPSVDRVGRYFPFTLCQPLPRGLPGAMAWPALLTGLQGLHEQAIAALEQEWTTDRLDAELLAGVAAEGQDAGEAMWAPDWLQARLTALRAGQVAWFHADGSATDTCFTTAGLPTGEAFDRLWGATRVAGD